MPYNSDMPSVLRGNYIGVGMRDRGTTDGFLSDDEKDAIADKDTRSALLMLKPSWLDYEKKMSPKGWKATSIFHLKSQLGLNGGYQPRLSREIRERLKALIADLEAV